MKSYCGKKTLSYIRVIDLTGGEPFLIPNFQDYYSLTRKLKRNAHINISTNGYCTSIILKFLYELNPVNTSITISYDGIHSHDAIRKVKGSAVKIVEHRNSNKKRLSPTSIVLENDNNE